MELSVIIVSYNTCKMTLECLESLVPQVRLGSSEIVVIDNDSADGSADEIAARYAEVKLIRLAENVGFARANNLAAKQASGEYLLLLNPDTLVMDRAVNNLMACARKYPHAGIWGGRTVFADGSLNPGSCWRRMTIWNQLCRVTGMTRIFPNSALFNSEAYGGWKRDTVRQVDIVSGCFCLLRRSLWDDLSGFDEAFFMYGEDADLCMRARAFGAKPMIAPDAAIVHYGGASEDIRADMIVRLLTAKTKLINHHWHRALRPIGRALVTAWCLSHCLFRSNARKLSKDAGEWGAVWRRRAEWRALTGYQRP